MFAPARLLLTLTFALSTATAFAQAPVDYLRDIKPILRARCYACHGALKQESGLRLDTGSSIRQGGDSGAAVVLGQAEKSLLIEKVSAKDVSKRMPPEGEPLTAAQIDNLRNWIAQGATSPVNEQPDPDPRQHWAFLRPQRPALPGVGASDRKQNPIDAFVEAELARQGLTPRPAAEKQVLLRRVYLDLIGLPPTRAELHEFLADNSPTAYEAVVDRLLNDPRHGERWARHWMDIWRYSDWYGRRHVPDVWNSAPQIWRWRDWIVRSLNADHGYDRMIREMLSADEICPEDDNAAVATGYLIRNWYALNPNDWMRNTVEHTGKAFLGLTFNCAHCHDHKYDPITQEDYFRLRAFFEPINVRQDRMPGEADPGPFQEYNYSTLRKIQRLGAVRIFDKSPEAPTWFYTGGDERNRVKDRGSIPPGVPAFLTDSALKITTVELPPRAWYPGLRPAIQDTVLAEARAAIAQADSELVAAKKLGSEIPPAVRDQLAQAEAAFNTAVKEAEKSQRPGALVGRQSLLLEATTGRRVVQNGMSSLKSLEDGTTLAFELLILNDAHVNFQLAKDVVKGLIAGYVAFEKRRIVSYQPGTFTEFETGRYDFANGQKRFRVTLVLETKADRCLLTVRSVADDKLLVDRVPIALNGWNPVGDATKAISFDCRTGSVAVIDEITLAAPLPAESAVGTSPARLVTFNFEPPAYFDGRDIGGIEGWSVSSLGMPPATSVVSSTAGNESLRNVTQQVQTTRRAMEAATLPLRAAESKLNAARAELLSVEARIAADRAKHGETPGADVSALARSASRLERDAAVLKADADVVAQERTLAIAEAKPMTDANRAKEIDAANKQLATSRPALDKARAAASMTTEVYSPFSPSYPQTSTGRRKALADWMTGRDNPLTARVAINHIWARHFHSPLVASVTDFGLNGAKPTHPELLDWLAVELMENGWSMKHVHRLIVTSAAYRRASNVGWDSIPTSSAAAAFSNAQNRRDGIPSYEVDPENKFLWRMNPGRMEAEVVRDSLLYAAGKLDPKIGGQELENTDALTTFRRSLYYSVYPEQGGKSQLGELFDAPDALECYRRTRSVVPQQALALTNSDLVHQVSSLLAAEEGARGGGGEGQTDDNAFVVGCFERILTRAPSARELEICLEALQNQRAVFTKSQVADASLRARASLVRALFNHNEFVTIR
jgi:mono/diheme cytochrome c family protein